MSLRSRLLILVALAILGPAILVGVRFVQERAKEIDSTLENMAIAVRIVAEDLEDKIQGTAQLHYGLARASDLETRDRDVCSAFLSSVREAHPQYTGILTIDPDGNLFCDSLRTGRSLDLRDRRYFREAIAADGGVTLQPAFGRLTGMAVLQIAHPARVPSGELKFVLLASLDLSKFVANHHRRLPGVEILLLDRDGTVLVWTRGTHETVHGGDTIRDTALYRFASESPTARVGAVAEAGGRIDYWAVAGPGKVDTGLFVLLGVPRAEILAPADRRLWQDIVVLVAVSVAAFAAAWLIAELGVRREVVRMSTMASRLGKGDLSARIPLPHPKGELGALMAVMNGTAESLQRQRESIEELDRKLHQAQKMEAIGQLTGGVAHDFNNLLTVILGNAEALADRLDDRAELRRLAEMTASAAERGAELTRRLLAFARRQALEPRSIDLNRLVGSMDGLLRRTLSEEIDLEIVRGGGLWIVETDPGQMEVALLNLAINARDAMPGGGRLTIETANVSLDDAYARVNEDVVAGQHVMVSVSDTGTGMAPEVLARVFEPFFTTKEVGKGSGLGLSMVYGFVKQSGGHVKVYSEVGQGTTIKIYLPRAAADSEAPPLSPQRNEKGGNEHVLVVEDDALVREHATSLLRDLGYRVTAVEAGQPALEALRGHADIALLFTDIVMPGGMNGRELADAARRLRPGLAVLFTSGYTENAIVHHGRVDTGAELLGKPYRRHELAGKVRKVLDAGYAARGGAR
ncbi:MAG: response regulator [Enhydrobacter sp.]|nr:MAG: response regulator [Enhydrobacter sp.]